LTVFSIIDYSHKSQLSNALILMSGYTLTQIQPVDSDKIPN